MVFSTLFFLYFVYGLLHCQLSSLSNILFMSLFSKRRGGGRGEEKEEEENQESSMALSPLVSHGPLSLREQLIFPLSIPRMVIPVVNPGSLPNLCLFFFFFPPGLLTGSGLRQPHVSRQTVSPKPKDKSCFFKPGFPKLFFCLKIYLYSSE